MAEEMTSFRAALVGLENSILQNDPSETRKLASDRPRCLEGSKFAFAKEIRIDERVNALAFAVRCTNCDTSEFVLKQRLLGDSITALELECQNCKQLIEIFDGTKHGYDGELGNTDHLSGEGTFQKYCGDGQVPVTLKNVHARFTYNIELSELGEISKDEHISSIDLFDWFEIVIGDPDDGEVPWQYECA